ncbi:MAG: hypothetical protein AAFV53_11360 [Myxococcota bacterium]
MTTPQEIEPEALYQRALKKLGVGQIDNAIKLLRVASLKAPLESRYRDTLQKAELMRKQQKVDTIDPELLYAKALEHVEKEEYEQASRLLKIALARAPGVSRYREALDKVREEKAPKKSELEAQGEELTKKASEDLERVPEELPPSESIQQHARRSARRSLVILLALTTLLAVLVLVLVRDGRPIDAAPYAQILPAVTSAQAVGPRMQEELVLTIETSAWTAMNAKQRTEAAERAQQYASDNGFAVIFLYSTEGQLLASVRDNMTYFSDD